MVKKAIVINGSPRKNGNTAKMLKETQKGAESVGAKVEYIDLIDLKNFKGCMSCFACKIKGSKTNGLCAYRDDLRPILEKVVSADAVFIGSPIYYSYPTGMFRNIVERMLFAGGSYKYDENNNLIKELKRKIPVGIIYTMNCPANLFDKFNYSTILSPNEKFLNLIYGYAETIMAYDTYQFNDYSKYDVNMFNEEHKREVREKQFPQDLKNAFDLGKKLIQMKL